MRANSVMRNEKKAGNAGKVGIDSYRAARRERENKTVSNKE